MASLSAFALIACVFRGPEQCGIAESPSLANYDGEGLGHESMAASSFAFSSSTETESALGDSKHI